MDEFDRLSISKLEKVTGRVFESIVDDIIRVRLDCFVINDPIKLHEYLKQVYTAGFESGQRYEAAKHQNI